MKKESSFGVIPISYNDKEPSVLLIQHYSGFWGFPKGHKEKGETDLEAAYRELFEETGLKIVKLLYTEPLIESYTFRFNKVLIDKRVHYYLAVVEGDLVIQKEEVKDAEWVPLHNAHHKATYSEGKAIINKVVSLLN